MKTEHILLGAGVIGIATYLFKSGGKRKPLILTDEEVEQRINQVNTVEKEVSTGRKETPKVSGRRLGGLELSYDEAAATIEQIKNAISDSEAKLRQDKINMYKAGLDYSHFEHNGKYEVENSIFELLSREIADFYVNIFQQSDFFKKYANGFKTFNSVKDMLIAYGYNPNIAYESKQTELVDIFVNMRNLYNNIITMINNTQSNVVDRDTVALHAAISDLRKRVINLAHNQQLIKRRVLDPAEPSNLEKQSAKKELDILLGERPADIIEEIKAA